MRKAVVMAVASQDVGLLIECDGVLIDVNTDGHRVAFNRAFADLGLECADWSPQIYHDLQRSGDGTAEGMLATFFDKIGWPMAVATDERAAFMSSVHKLKDKMLRKMVQQGELPLRPGCLEFVDAALNDGAKVGVISCTISKPEDDIFSCVANQLGEERWSKIQLFPQQPGKEIPFVADQSEFDALNDHVQDRVAEVKRKEAEAFQSTVASINSEGIQMDIDPALLAGRTSGITPSWLAAVAVTMGCSLKDCAIVAATNDMAQVAAAAGAVSLAVPAGLAQRGSFPGAMSTFDGFGAGGGLTWNRVVALLKERAVM